MEDEDDSSASFSVHLTHRVSTCFFFDEIMAGQPTYLPPKVPPQKSKELLGAD